MTNTVINASTLWEVINMPVMDRIKKAWNAFRIPNEVQDQYFDYSTPYYGNISPSRTRTNTYSERSIISSIYTRISIDVAGISY